jgi:hypothetical protein
LPLDKRFFVVGFGFRELLVQVEHGGDKQNHSVVSGLVRGRGKVYSADGEEILLVFFVLSGDLIKSRGIGTNVNNPYFKLNRYTAS